MSSEALLETRQDRPCGPDGELLADHLEDEHPKGVERRKLLDPCPRAEVRMRVDQARENRVGVSQELARLGIGDGGWPAGHSWSRRSARCAHATIVHLP